MDIILVVRRSDLGLQRNGGSRNAQYRRECGRASCHTGSDVPKLLMRRITPYFQELLMSVTVVGATT